MRLNRYTFAACAVTFLLPAGAWGEEDFIRGDVNADGVVSISDAHVLLSYLKGWGLVPECLNAADVDDSGVLDQEDLYRLIDLPVRGGTQYDPFSSPGPDPTPNPDPGLVCEAFGGGQSVEDPAASLEIIDAVSVVPNVGRFTSETAIITFSLTTSVTVAGYWGKIRVGDLFERGGGGVIYRGDGKQYGALSSNVWVEDGELRFGMVGNYYGDSPNVLIPPGDHRPAIIVWMSLKPGVRAGEYPLTFEAGELIEAESGRRIVPSVVGGTLRVRGEPGETVVGPNVVFTLGTALGSPGGEVTVPFIQRADARGDGYSISLDFDEGVLQVLSVENVFHNPDGSPTSFQKLRFDNQDLTPGNAGVDEGFVAGAVIANLDPRYPMEQIPADQDNTMLDIRFRVNPQATATFTEIRFLDDARPPGGPTFRNVMSIGGTSYLPETAASFVFLNGRINIIPDGMPFRRGDSNLDLVVDLSDAQHALAYLFLGEGSLPCPDATDANDDGRIDLADPIAILGHLFLGSESLPPPHEPARDPTADSLDC